MSGTVSARRSDARVCVRAARVELPGPCGAVTGGCGLLGLRLTIG